jgi:hypothetical protein
MIDLGEPLERYTYTDLEDSLGNTVSNSLRGWVWAPVVNTLYECLLDSLHSSLGDSLRESLYD